MFVYKISDLSNFQALLSRFRKPYIFIEDTTLLFIFQFVLFISKT